jgi:TIR domain-containing protein
VGLPDRLIDYLPSLLEEATHYCSSFISYSSKDDTFAHRLHAELQNTGVRCWFAPHDLPIGAKTLDVIDAAILLRDKLLLILSKNAIAKIGWRTRSARCSPRRNAAGSSCSFPSGSMRRW